jgi:hypothetical protein
MEVPVSDGLVEFRYVHRLPDVIGSAISLATLPIYVLVLLGWRRSDRFKDIVGWLIARRKRFVWAALSVAALGLIWAVYRGSTREHMLPKNSLFHQVASGQLMRGDNLCEKEGSLAFQCNGGFVRAEMVPGLYGAHMCMTSPGMVPVKIEMPIKLGQLLQVRYEPENETGEVKLTVDGTLLGSSPVINGDVGLRYVQFDTHEYAAQPKSNIRLEISGGALNCFDVRLDP